MRAARWVGIIGVGLLIAGGCSSDDEEKGGTGGTSGASASGGTGTGAAGTGGGVGGGIGGAAATDGSVGGGGGGGCKPVTCQGKTYQCGDCIDNDGDGKIDVGSDPDCLGPCHNAENTFYGSIPGQAGPACTVDCYFDQDSGAGNDNCCWDHRCDPLAVAPSYPPEGPTAECPYMGAQQTSKYSPSCSQSTCDELYDKAKGGQADVCESFCGPLTPNGCDCFGCCELPAHSGKFVWLGSEGADGLGTCDLASMDDPTKCQPCTPVQACLNACETCEKCIGKDELPPECFDGGGGSAGAGGCPPAPACPVGQNPCDPDLPECFPACPDGSFCLTGCCAPIPG